MKSLSLIVKSIAQSASIFIATMLSFAALASEVKCNKTLTVHLDLHAPSAFLDKDGQVAGMDAILAHRILTQAGCKVKWHLVPMTGERILRSLQQGHFDVMIRASKTAEREKYAYFSAPYRDEVVGLFSRKQLKLPSNFSMLDALEKRLSLIGPVSGWYGEEFELLRNRWMQDERYTPYPNAKRATELLFSEPSRGDLLLVDADIFYFHLGKERFEQVKLVGKNLHITPALLMFSQSAIDKTDLAAIDRSISQMQQTGELKTIIDNYRPSVLQKLIKANL